MSGFDFIIGAIFLVSILIGVLRGFIREALSIISWVVSLWLAVTYCQPAGEFISQYINIPADAFRTAAGFAFLFVSSLFVFSIISFVIKKLTSNNAIKGTDRALGLIFGALRAIAIVIAVMLVTRGMGMGQSDWWKNSALIGYFEPLANYVEEILPEQLRSSTNAEDVFPSEETETSAQESKIIIESSNLDSSN